MANAETNSDQDKAYTCTDMTRNVVLRGVRELLQNLETVMDTEHWKYLEGLLEKADQYDGLYELCGGKLEEQLSDKDAEIARLEAEVE